MFTPAFVHSDVWDSYVCPKIPKILLLYKVRDIKKKSRENALAQHALPCKVRTSRQISCNQKLSALHCISNAEYVPGERTCTRSVAKPPRSDHIFVTVCLLYLSKSYHHVPLSHNQEQLCSVCPEIPSGRSSQVSSPF